MIIIKDKKQCCGCTACYNICPKQCISMQPDNEGFLYPIVDADKCINCGMCENVCPVAHTAKEESFQQKGYIVQNKDEQILSESTAGGAFTAIAEYVLQKNGVVFGAALSDDIKVRHIYVEYTGELYKFRNSKYVQSTGGGYLQVKSFLEQGKLVCYSGTPCQIEGLKNFLKKDYENLITVDVVCRAVPSPKIFEKYLEYQEKHLADSVKNVRFRDKHYEYKYSTMNVVTDKNRKEYHKGIDSDPWLRAFFSNICDRPSCYDCQFKKRYRQSDFTIWDCLNIAKFSKELDNDKGATRVLVHTYKGREIFNSVAEKFRYVEVEPDKLVEGSREMVKSVEGNLDREAFFKDAEHMKGDELFQKYFPETLRVKVEHAIRIMCYKIGIYGVMKKLYVKLTHKY